MKMHCIGCDQLKRNMEAEMVRERTFQARRRCYDCGMELSVIRPTPPVWAQCTQCGTDTRYRSKYSGSPMCGDCLC